MTPRRWIVRLAAAAVLTSGIAGCGSEETPVQQEPALAEALAEVDAAAAAGDDARLEEAVAGLVRVTDEAEEAGDLDGDDADRIRDAAEALLEAASPEPEPEPEPAESSTTTSEPPAEPETTTSSPAPPPEEDDDEDEDDEDDDEGSDDGSKPPKGGKGPKKP